MGQGFLQVPFGVWYSQAKILLEFIALLWIVSFIDLALLNHSLFWAVAQKPRTIGGFFYLPFRSLFHSDWDHLVGNTSYLLLFGGLIVFQDPSQILMVTIVSMFAAGWGLWLVGRPGPYCGASGTVFGYLGFVMTRAIVQKDAVSAILISWLFFSFLFGSHSFFFNQEGLKSVKNTVGADKFVFDVKWSLWTVGDSFWGIFPGKNPQVSWEGHFLGLISGIFAAQYSNVLTPWVNQLALWVQQSR